MMKSFVIFLLLFLLSACGSVYVHARHPLQVYPFQGVQHSMSQIGRSWQKPVLPGEPVVWVTDVPLSLVLDIVLLPYDLTIVLSKPDLQPPSR